MEERSVVKSLNDLDTLIAEARATQDRAVKMSQENGQPLVYPNP